MNVLESVCAMEEQFLRNLKGKTDIEPGDRILVAVSGGMDSVLLLYLLNKYKKEIGIEIEAAHINHMLRPKDSDKDQQLVKKLCKDWSINYHTINIDVKKISQTNKWSVEEGARKLRYEYLKGLKEQFSFNKIAVAHHHKDQAETILMHLIRGTGAEGLRGMFIDKDDIIRPLLNITREDIENRVEELELEYRTDKSNLQTRYARNKIRIKLLPILRKYNPQIESNLVKTGEIIREDNDFIETEVVKYYNKYIQVKDNYMIIDEKIKEIHLAIRRRLLIKAYKELSHMYLEYKYVEKADEFIKNDLYKQKQKLGLPNGIKLYRNKEGLLLDMRKKPCIQDSVEVLIEKPGQYEYAGKQLNIEIITEIPTKDIYIKRGSDDGYVDFDKLTWPLMVRNRKAGDTFFVIGEKSERKLKKLLIDRGIEANKRNTMPFILDADGKVVFIPVIGTSELFKIDDNTVTILHFSYR
jgi:tRNA(Ile)-lysidine synthase